ncbi:MAG: hypothetical protein MZU97_21415 [Bacillus subtilis]|nr:hypothetical protein [Bacillus subtilis]
MAQAGMAFIIATNKQHYDILKNVDRLVSFGRDERPCGRNGSSRVL